MSTKTKTMSKKVVDTEISGKEVASKQVTANKGASKKKPEKKKLSYPRFSVKNLGTINEGEFTHKPLTIFCGPNNSGKTWAMHSLYASYGLMKKYLLLKLSNEINPAYFTNESVLEDKEFEHAGFIPVIDQHDLVPFNGILSSGLEELFNADLGLLADAEFNLELEDPTQFSHFISKISLRHHFLMPAERCGLELLFHELSSRRTSLLHQASRENVNLNDLLSDVIRSRYSSPIAMFIDWLNELTEFQRRPRCTDFKHFAEEIQKTIVKGVYKVDARTGDITFKPYQQKGANKTPQRMGLHLTSGTVKSLFGLWFFLKNQAQHGDLLMID